MTEAELNELASGKVPDDIELFYPNYWYGFSNIIKRYCHWPLPLPVVIPHGLDFGFQNICNGEVSSKLPGVLCYQDCREEVYRAKSNLEILKGSSPWLYLLRIKNYSRKHTNGIIVFPPHSSVTIDTFIKSENLFIKKVLDLRGEYEEVTVCIYWLDILAGRHKLYMDHGIEVVTAGNMFDPLFSDRLFEILKTKKYLYTPIIGSHIFYAASLGLDILLDESFDYSFNAGKDVLEKDLWPQDEALIQNIREIFRQPVLEKKIRFATSQLGGDYFSSKISLFIKLFLLSLKNSWIKKAIDAKIKFRKGAPFIELMNLKIEEWGPQSSKAGDIPNIQQDGSAAIWIRINPDAVLVDGDVYVNNKKALGTQKNAGLITSKIDSTYFSSPGILSIDIKDSSLTKKINLGNIIVN